jgi:23S rRNA (cytosine1962-C5)-methyltransferase
MTSGNTSGMVPLIKILTAPAWVDYALIDSGNGKKLEKFGPYLFVRPEHQATWPPHLLPIQWEKAHAVFQASSGEETGGHWHQTQTVENSWKMKYKNLTFLARFSNSRHLGVFPEQAAHWDWVSRCIKGTKSQAHVLNLFGYTGLATLAAAQAGGHVTHLDAAKKSISWARQNQSLSGLVDRPIRWIVDDAMKFVQREVRRGVKYDGIIMDPPKFGRGPKGEIWDGLEMLSELLRLCFQILKPQPTFVVITAYAIRASALSLYYALEPWTREIGGKLTCGELATVEKSAQRIISSAIYARWSLRDHDEDG